MTGWIALALIVAVGLATAAIFRAGRRTGAAVEATKAREAELNSQQEALDAHDRMLDAARYRPVDRDDLARRLRDGTF